MRKPKPPKLVTVAIFTTITVVLWIFFEVYETLTSPPEITVPKELLEPINPVLDVSALESVETRLYFEESDVANIRFSDLSGQSENFIQKSMPTEQNETETIEIPSEITPSQASE